MSDMLSVFEQVADQNGSHARLPIERHANHRPMLHDVQGVLAEPAILAEFYNGQRT